MAALPGNDSDHAFGAVDVNVALVVSGVASRRPGAGGTTAASRLRRSNDMSADKDRGIRRIRQKRAKALKKLERRQREAGGAPAAAAAPPRRQPA